MKIDNRNLAKTLADLVADDHNNSMNDVQSVEIEMSNKKSFRTQVMATSNSSVILDFSMFVSLLGDNDNKIKDLIITEKGKLKGHSDLISLQLFLDETLNIRGNWTTASRVKTLKDDNVIIRWYSYNESLTIGGSDAEKVKLYLKLRAMTNIKADISETDSARQI